MFQIEVARQTYLNLCIRLKYIKHRLKTSTGDALIVDENSHADLARQLNPAANTVYLKFLQIYESYQRGLLRHERWIMELIKMRDFLLDSQLINCRRLQYAQLLNIVNKYIQ